MKHALTTYDFNSHTIRVVTIDEAPWFLAADVCRVLDMPLDRGVGKYLGNLSADEKRPVTPGQIGGKGMSRTSLISESGLYKLILRSDKPEARPFQDWVTKVVLPAIRKDGGYVAGEETLGQPDGMGEDEFIAKALLMAQRKIERVIEERDRALGEAAVAKAEVEALEEDRDFITVDRFRTDLGEYWPHRFKTQLGVLAASLCRQRGIEIGRQERRLAGGRGIGSHLQSGSR